MIRFAPLKKSPILPQRCPDLFWLDALCMLIGISVYLYALFPVHMTGDEMVMWQDAHALRYSDRWPPFTLWLWHYLNHLWDGGDLMLLINLAFLWSAIWTGLRLLAPKPSANGTQALYPIRYWFLCIPFIPAIFFDAGHLLKDTIFSFGYMFLSLYLAQKTLVFYEENKGLSCWQSLWLLCALLYFSMVKVQAEYIVPFMLAWIIALQARISRLSIKILLWIVLSALFLNGMQACHRFFILEKNDLHYWQYVKIYDLAGMTVFSHHNYLPDFLFKKTPTPHPHDPEIIQDIQNHYDYLWEPLIHEPDSPLQATKNAEERLALRQAWSAALFSDPLAYIQHRCRVWLKTLYGSTAKGAFIDWASAQHPSWLWAAPIFQIFSFLPFFPLLIYGLFLGARSMRSNPHALSLFMLSGMGLTLIMVLFVCSLAAAARYIYFSWCCLAFAIPFGYRVLIDKRRSLTQAMISG